MLGPRSVRTRSCSRPGGAVLPGACRRWWTSRTCSPPRCWASPTSSARRSCWGCRARAPRCRAGCTCWLPHTPSACAAPAAWSWPSALTGCGRSGARRCQRSAPSTCAARARPWRPGEAAAAHSPPRAASPAASGRCCTAQRRTCPRTAVRTGCPPSGATSPTFSNAPTARSTLRRGSASPTPARWPRDETRCCGYGVFTTR
mmetsp:Transcript_25568/g.65849  ORF Transcript_25568/g.65849 Transcript_25568/m.65849 type:complete len:202 (-) Transcript_25568:790-1395(-)